MKSTLATAFTAGPLALLLALGPVGPAAADGRKKSDPLVERGRYVAKIAGCHDCHSPGYLAVNGKTEERTWLTGDTLGWRGPWGTTYPSNLRLVAGAMTERRFMERARDDTLRPPMPWFNLRAMNDADLRAIYRYLKHLGPAGGPAPEAVAPGAQPAGPFVQFPMPPK